MCNRGIRVHVDSNLMIEIFIIISKKNLFQFSIKIIIFTSNN